MHDVEPSLLNTLCVCVGERGNKLVRYPAIGGLDSGSARSRLRHKATTTMGHRQREAMQSHQDTPTHEAGHKSSVTGPDEILILERETHFGLL